MKWAVALHRDDGVGDHVVDRDGGGEFEDGAVDALPAQWWVVYLGHRDQDVSAEDRVGEPEFAQACQASLQRDAAHVVEVEVDELGATDGFELFGESAFFEEQVGVSDVAGTFGDGHGGGAEAVGIAREDGDARVCGSADGRSCGAELVIASPVVAASESPPRMDLRFISSGLQR